MNNPPTRLEALIEARRIRIATERQFKSIFGYNMSGYRKKRYRPLVEILFNFLYYVRYHLIKLPHWYIGFKAVPCVLCGTRLPICKGRFNGLNESSEAKIRCLNRECKMETGWIGVVHIKGLFGNKFKYGTMAEEAALYKWNELNKEE